MGDNIRIKPTSNKLSLSSLSTVTATLPLSMCSHPRKRSFADVIRSFRCFEKPCLRPPRMNLNLLLTACADNKSLASTEQTSTSKRPRLRSHKLTLYQCRICHHSYQRADRLSRHLKSHENARRYICHICQKGFNRVDHLSRHVLTHKRKKATTGSESLTNIHKAKRTSQACFACASAKARCEEQNLVSAARLER